MSRHGDRTSSRRAQLGFIGLLENSRRRLGKSAAASLRREWRSGGEPRIPKTGVASSAKGRAGRLSAGKKVGVEGRNEGKASLGSVPPQGVTPIATIWKVVLFGENITARLVG